MLTQQTDEEIGPEFMELLNSVITVLEGHQLEIVLGVLMTLLSKTLKHEEDVGVRNQMAADIVEMVNMSINDTTRKPSGKGIH